MSLPLERWSWGSLSVSVATVEGVNMNEIYMEYAKEHPEELAGIRSLKANAIQYERAKQKAQKKAISKVEKWREILDGEEYSK